VLGAVSAVFMLLVSGPGFALCQLKSAPGAVLASDDSSGLRAKDAVAAPRRKRTSVLPNSSSDLDGKVQVKPATELHIRDIQIQGNQTIPSAEIMRVLKTQKGDIFFRDQLIEDLKAINRLGWFDEYGSQIDPQLVDGSIVLKINVEENPTVKRVVFKGNGDIGEKDLIPLFDHQIGRPQNIELIGKSIDKVEQHFRERGYVLARVVDVKDTGNGTFTIDLDEGVIGEIEIVAGQTLKGYLQKRIRIKPGQIYNDRNLSNDLKNMNGDGFFQLLRRTLSASTADPSRYKLKVEEVYDDAPPVVAKGHAKTVFSATGAFVPSDPKSNPFRDGSTAGNPLLHRLKRLRSSGAAASN
jgi:outer membrane protein assembly factor BamA